MKEPSGSNRDSLQRTLTEQKQNKWSFTDIFQCWIYIGHGGQFVTLLIKRFDVLFMTISTQRFNITNFTTLVNCSLFNVWNTTFRLNVQTSYCKRFTKIIKHILYNSNSEFLCLHDSVGYTTKSWICQQTIRRSKLPPSSWHARIILQWIFPIWL